MHIFDIASIKSILGVITATLGILGIIFGWFGKAWKWVTSFTRRDRSAGGITIPRKTMILLPVTRRNALWWHMGGIANVPAMQIVGDLNVTNISNYDLVITCARLRRPKAVGHVSVRDQDSNLYSDRHAIPKGGISELRFDFWVQPPVLAAGKPFRSDVAIVDQFGNEHWLRAVTFQYQ